MPGIGTEQVHAAGQATWQSAPGSQALETVSCLVLPGFVGCTGGEKLQQFQLTCRPRARGHLKNLGKI